MHKSKKLAKITGVSTVLFVGLLFATGVVGSVRANMLRSHTDVEAIAQQLNMDSSDVQAVLDAVYDERHARKHEMLEERLTQAVEDGIITEEDKAAILAKHEEFRQQMESIKESSLSDEQMHSEFHQLREELREWMETNGYDTLRPEKDGHHGFGHMKLE